MLSALAVSFRTVLKRLAADWLVAGAAFVTIVLAIALLASGPIYADAVTLSALQRTLADAPVMDSNITIGVNVFPGLHDAADAAVRDTAEKAMRTTGADVYEHIEADAFELMGTEPSDIVELASFQYFEGIESRAELVGGRWPETDGPPHETVVNAAAARDLGLSLGDTIDVTSRRDASYTAKVVVVGLYEVVDPTDPFWFEDELAIQGSVTSNSFRTTGPFVVSLESMLSGFTPLRTNAEWRVLPHYDQLTVAEVDPLGAAVGALATDLDRALFSDIDQAGSGSSDFSVTTGLSALLANVDRSLTVTRSSVLTLLLQLALLAGYALVLTAGLLVDTRRTETSLLRSRGTSPGQILGTSALEGLVLAAPAAAVAPFIATWLLRILNRVGPLAAIDLSIHPVPTREAYLLALVAGSLSVVALTWPAVRAAQKFPESSGRHRRQLRASATQRLGVDVALIALAAIVLWQLRLLGPQISARVRGRFGVDPLLVVAPAIGLLTGAVLALRIVPLLARLSEWLASSGRSTVSALASWQVARRPVRYARSALLLMMAIGIGFFAASYSTTWIATQRDQADYRVGADTTVRPDRATGSSLTDLTLVSAHTSLPGVVDSMPVLRLLGQLGNTAGGLGQIVILDASKASDVVTIREDLAPVFDQLMQTLVDARPAMAGVDLPGEPVTVALDVEVVENLPEPEDLPQGVTPTIGFRGQARVVLQDGNGQLHRVIVGDIPANEGSNRLEAGLTDQLRDGTATPAYPLRVVDIEIRVQVPDDYSREVVLTIDGITVALGDGSTVTVPMTVSDWDLSTRQVVGVDRPPSMRPGQAAGGDSLALEMETGSGATPDAAYFSVRPRGTRLPATYPVVVSASFIDTGLADVGEEIRLPPLRIENDEVVLAGSIDAFPTLSPDLGPIIVVDLPTFETMGYAPGAGIPTVDEYWLRMGSDGESAEAMLQAPPISSFQLVSTQRLVDRLVSDPVALGTIGALTVGFVAAAVFAAVGFAVSATVSARERLIEFALLRALGLSPRQLGSWLTLEQGVLVVVSLGLGTVIGMLLTATLLPLVTLTQGGRPAMPEVVVSYPWTTVIGLELAVVGVLGVIVAILTVVLRRVGLGSMLRLGED